MIFLIEKFCLNKTITPMPVIQGGMGVRISGSRLVLAMIDEGCAGTLAGAGLTPIQLQKEIQKIEEGHVKGIFGVNLMVVQGEFPQLLEVCIEKQVPFVALGAGFSPDAIKKLIRAEIPVFVIVSSLQAARLAFIVASNTAKRLQINLRPGAFGIIIEAPDMAGGHLGISAKSAEEIEECLKVSIWELLSEIEPFMRKAGFLGPIVAAGGILHGSDIKRAFNMGANAVQMGTRFLMSMESNASQAVKKLLVGTKNTQVNISPVKLPLRTIYPQTVSTLPKPRDIGKCPGCLPSCPHDSYCIFLALINTTKNNIPIEECLICAGARIGEINDILPVSEIIRTLRENFKQFQNKGR